MVELTLAMALFVGLHFILSSYPLRDRLVARLGERPFRRLYSVVMAVTLVWSAVAFNRAPFELLWTVPGWLAPLPVLLMPLAVLLLVCSLTQPNPTLAGLEADPATAGGIFAVTRHPMLWAFAIWGLLHLLANGDLAALIFFGGFTVLSLGGALAIDARKRREWPGETWRRFAGRTSWLPFAALIAGRARLRFGDIGGWRLLLAAAVFAALLAAHPTVFGVSPVPMR